MKIFLPIIFFISLNLFAQRIDSISVDTTKRFSDSLFTTSKDSLAIDTTKYVKADTLYPIYQKPLYDGSFFINRKTIDKLDYRYMGDLFSPAGFTFLKDKGQIGQPNELTIYGNGFGMTGFFSDGILFNNRYTDILDLNFVQNELIDSIEVLPLPRGFLYGPDNYMASANFIERDFLSSVPYTRIKYYEGPNGEAFVDGIFNTSFLKRLNLTFDITNRKFDSTYTNSNFSIWQAEFRLKYFVSNKINLIGSYSLVSSDVGLNGGVNVDSIAKITNDINSVLYEPLSAPVVNSSLSREVKLDKFKLRMLGDFNNFNTDLNFYYHSSKENYSGIASKDEIKNFTWGAALRQSYSKKSLHLEIKSVFERRESRYYYLDTFAGAQNIKNSYNVFSISPVVSFYLLDSTIVPSAFYKNTNYSDIGKSYDGVGGDVTVKLLNILQVYAGISSFDFFGLQTDVYQIGARINYESLFTNVTMYSRKISPSTNQLYTNGLILQYGLFESAGNLTGFALNLNYNFWKIGLEESINYNSYKEDKSALSSEIKMHINSSVFYKDTLFSQDLDLKTGFVLNYYDSESDNFKSASQLDFTIAGTIRKVAIVYFSWENLLNEKYFIVPYYPMRERGIRFGIAWELFN